MREIHRAYHPIFENNFKRMNIGLIFPNKDRRYKTIHLGLAYIAAFARLHHDDLTFKVLDTRVATRREEKDFYDSNFDLIGITVFSPVYLEVIEIFNKIKQKNSELPVCLGGPYVTTIMQDIFDETPAEYAIYGEGEESFNELLWFLKGKGSLDKIQGLMYKKADNGIFTNPQRDRIKILDHLPTPAYDIFPMERYPLHRFVASRGCPFSCAWCNSSSLWKNGHFVMGAEKVVDEIEYLLKNYGEKSVIFGDNTFNSDIKRVEKFCDLLIDRNIKILWSVSLRPDNINLEIAQKMKRSGCFNVSIGIESANNEILKKIGKGTSIEKIKQGIDILKTAGIEIMSQYVIGSPFDTLETVKQSIIFAKSSGCDYTNFYTVLPFKGTPQWEYVKKHGKLFENKIHKFHSINPRVVFETPEFDYKERLQAIELVRKEGFYSNKDKKNWLFDFAKDISNRIQNILPYKIGENVYMILKSIYRLKIFKKNNL